MAGTRNWFKMVLPDSTIGFVHMDVVTPLKPIYSTMLKERTPLYAYPEINPFIIDTIQSGEKVKVMGTFSGFSYIQLNNNKSGWMRVINN